MNLNNLIKPIKRQESDGGNTYTPIQEIMRIKHEKWYECENIIPPKPYIVNKVEALLFDLTSEEQYFEVLINPDGGIDLYQNFGSISRYINFFNSEEILIHSFTTVKNKMPSIIETYVSLDVVRSYISAVRRINRIYRFNSLLNNYRVIVDYEYPNEQALENGYCILEGHTLSSPNKYQMRHISGGMEITINDDVYIAGNNGVIIYKPHGLEEYQKIWSEAYDFIMGYLPLSD